MEHDQVTNLDDIGLRYRVRVLLTHPEADLQVITQTTGLSPNVYWIKGSKRFAPNGREVPSLHQKSTWSYWVDVENTREFAATIARVVGLLMPGMAAIQHLLATNGQATLIVELPGGKNIGDILPPGTMAKLTELGLSLGIEVFPNS